MSVFLNPQARRPGPGRVDFTKRQIAPDVPPPVGPVGPWETLPVHGVVMEQPTAVGRTVRALTPHGDLVLAGYGDYSENTGPIRVIAYNVVDGSPVQLHVNNTVGDNVPVPTEAIDRYRIIDGRAYAPYTDPTGLDTGGFATDRTGSEPNQTWTLTTMPERTMLHCYDVAKIAGKIVVCGSSLDGEGPDNGPSVWQEQANGTFTRVLFDTTVVMDPESPILNYPRFYHFFTGTGLGALAVQAMDYPTHTYASDDGTTWTRHETAPNLYPPSWQPSWPLPAGSTSYCEAGGYAWVSGADGLVQRAPLATP